MLAAEPASAQAYRRLRHDIADRDLRGPASLRSPRRRPRVRRDIVTMIDSAQLGHIGGDLSVTDILVTLFGAVLNVDPEHPDRPDRDRFVLSKGHCAGGALRDARAVRVLPPRGARHVHGAAVDAQRAPDRKKVPGVETNTGPLGHGFPVAVGCALAAKLRGASWRTFVVLGDGEIQEGSNWEAAMTAPHYELASITAIVDRNRLQQGARTEDTKRLEPFADKWASFGWEVREIDGHDYGALLDAFAPSTTGKPVARDRQHDQGQGRLVHRGPRRVASQGARPPTRCRPRSRSSRDDAHRAHQRRPDLRLPQGVRRAAHRARPRGRADRGGLQRLRRLEQPGRLPRRASPTGSSTSASPSRTSSAWAPAWPTAGSSRSSPPRRRS